MSEPTITIDDIVLPAGAITGHAGSVHADGYDPDPNPDLSAWEGVRVSFTPTVPLVILTTDDGPVMLEPRVETGRFVGGRLVLDLNPPEGGERQPLRLWASTGQTMVPETWGWQATLKGDGLDPKIAKIKAPAFILEPGAVVDVADIIAGNLPEAPVPVWTDFMAALAEMRQIRDNVTEISGLTGEDDAVAALVSNPASDTGAAVRAAAGSTPAPATDASVAALVDGPATDTAAALDRRAMGANLPRTLAKLRAGEPVAVTIIGDSKMDPAAPGNAGGTAVDKLIAEIGAWSDSPIAVTNVAKSGATIATQHLTGAVGVAVASAPDLVVVEIGTNDSNADQYGSWAAGYDKVASWAAVERVCAYVRDVNEAAEVVFVGTTPYLPSMAGSNEKIVAYNAGMKALAATVGAEWVDGYAAFQSVGDWSSLLLDSTHRNDAGNAVLGAALAEHFPTTGRLMAVALAPRPRSGKYGIDRVDKAAPFLGYATVAAPAVGPYLTMAVTGTGWTADGAYDVTSTAGDAISIGSTPGVHVSELLANVDLGSAAVGTAYPVVDIYLDDALQAADVNLHTQSGKDSTAYWVAFFTGLSPAEHTMKLVLKSGTLRVQLAAGLVAAPQASGAYVPTVKMLDLSPGTVSMAMTTSYANALPLTAIPLPAGWLAMDVEVDVELIFRTTATTTTNRVVNYSVRDNGTAIGGTRTASLLPSTGDTFRPAINFHGLLQGKTGAVSLDVLARVTGADTNLTQLTFCYVYAHLTRVA